jgi:hypothetical protein
MNFLGPDKDCLHKFHQSTVYTGWDETLILRWLPFPTFLENTDTHTHICTTTHRERGSNTAQKGEELTDLHTSTMKTEIACISEPLASLPITTHSISSDNETEALLYSHIRPMKSEMKYFHSCYWSWKICIYLY